MRALLIATAIVSAILGAVVVYLVLTVPNDLQAAALMKTARKQIADGDREHARQSLARIVQQYPRTDAAAAATVALVSIADADRQKLMADVTAMRHDAAAQEKQISDLTQRLNELASRPVPQPVVVQVTKPPAPKKRTPAPATRRRRR
jgi:hypothetical protein